VINMEIEQKYPFLSKSEYGYKHKSKHEHKLAAKSDTWENVPLLRLQELCYICCLLRNRGIMDRISRPALVGIIQEELGCSESKAYSISKAVLCIMRLVV